MLLSSRVRLFLGVGEIITGEFRNSPLLGFRFDVAQGMLTLEGIRSVRARARLLSCTYCNCGSSCIFPHSITIASIQQSTMDAGQDMSHHLVNLEESFYQTGMASGRPHGELHGLFEGRTLGREKAWEMWEEAGYYEGTARVWKSILIANDMKDGRQAWPNTAIKGFALTRRDYSRAFTNFDQITNLVGTLPLNNDSQRATQAGSSSDVDILATLAALRTRYRAACASLGIRPRMVATTGAGHVQAELGL